MGATVPVRKMYRLARDDAVLREHVQDERV